MATKTRTRFFQNFALSATRFLPQKKRAIWLTTFYRLYLVVFLRHRETWLTNKSHNLVGFRKILKIIPASKRVELDNIVYVLQGHVNGHILPGVWKALDQNSSLNSEDMRGGLPADAFPAWMVEDLKAISLLEADLFPSDEFFSRFHSWSAPIDSTPGDILKKIWLNLSKRKFDVVVLAPWIRTGGADKGIIQHLHYYQSKFKSVLLLTTYPGPSNRIDRIPQGVTCCEIGEDLQLLSSNEQCLILARLILLLQPKLIHNINSDLGWMTYQRHGKAFRTESIRLISSIFSDEVTPSGQRFGYGINYLPTCRKILDGLVFDSKENADRYSDCYGIDTNKVYPIHFYVDADDAIAEPSQPSVTMVEGSKNQHVLWASRICSQKRPDLLFEIVQLFPNVMFEVFGPIEAESSQWALKLQKQKNVKMFGEYSNLHKVIRAKPYTALLYTTAFDGVPNVLLEAIMEKLPVIAPPHIGGLGDIINEETGWCVEGRDAESYASALRQALGNPELSYQKAESAFKLLETDFSKVRFNDGMTEMMTDLNLKDYFMQ